MNLQTLGIETLSILWRANWQASVLILAVLALRLFFGRHLTAQWRCRLWMLVMLRLILPTIPSSPWSLFNLFHAPEPVVSVSHEIAFPAKIIFVEAAESSPVVTPERVRTPIDWNAILITVWLMWRNDIWTLVYPRKYSFRPQNPRFHGSTVGGNDPTIPSLCQRIAHRPRTQNTTLGSNSHPQPLWSLSSLTPAPNRLLHKSFAGRSARLIFLHELAHIRRNDLPIAWIAALLRIIHWFNPLVWIAIKTWRADMESACDDTVLAMTEPTDHARYGLILLKLATQSIASTPLPALGIVGGRMQLRRRIIAISRFKRPAALWSIAAGRHFGIDASTRINRRPRRIANHANDSSIRSGHPRL